MKKLDKILFGNILDIISKNRTFLYLLLIVIVGFILRTVAASHLAPSADEAVYGTHAINFINSGAVSNQNQSPVWFFLADLFYKIFGITLLTARLTSIIFSVLTILLVFLLAKELFNHKIALISASLFAISAFSIRYMVMEMDPTFTFFFFLSAYLFIIGLLRKNKISILSAVFLGVAILAKALSAILIVSFFLIYLVYYVKNKDKGNILLGWNNIRRVFISMFVVVVLLIPIIAYNILLYKEKGLTDVMFARFFNVSKEFYASISPTIQPFSFSSALSHIYGPLDTIINYDSLIVILSVIGLILTLIKNRFQLLILLFLLIPVYIFIGGTSLLANHFVVFLPVIIILSSIPIYFVQEKFKKKHIAILLIIFIALINVFTLREVFTTGSAIGKLREFTIENINDSSLVIADGRIYRGRIAWMFNDRHYIESSLVDDVFNSLEKINSQEIPIKTYFIECIKDDCGWGTIKDQPDFNQSSENLVRIFNNISFKKTDIIGGGGYDEVAGAPYFRVYETRIQAKPQVLDAADKTHHFFFYPVRWTPKEAIYDAYIPKGFFDKKLDVTSHLVLYLAIFIALASIPYIIYLIFENLKIGNKSNDADEAVSNNPSLQ